MLSLFKSDQHAKAYKALLSDDLDKFTKALQKITTETIDQPVSDSLPSLAECCILQQAPKALKGVLDKGADPSRQSSTRADCRLTELALHQEQSLPLLSALLTANPQTDLSDLLIKCFELRQDNTLMLHLSLLLQNGAKITEQAVHLSLASADLPLIHFIINSGAEQPSSITGKGYSDETIAYANKCWEDLKIRQMFL